MREPEERFAPTALDFFVEDVRLVAAAARAGALPELRDFDALDAELFEEPLAAVRDFAAVRAELFEPPRAALEREVLEREVLEREAVLLDAAFLAVLRAGLFAADFAVDFAADLAGAFFAAVFFAPDFAALRLVVDLDAAFLAVLLRAEDFAADLVPDFDAVFDPLFEPLVRDEVAAFFAADLRAVEVPLFLALDVPLFLLEELRRALLFFLVLVAPESPVNSIVSGFDFSSVGIAASFKGLRVQPSRFEGNVVIPRGFRLTESVESKSGTFSVDTFLPTMLWDLHAEGATHPERLLPHGRRPASAAVFGALLHAKKPV